MIILVANCYKNLGGRGVVALLLCSRKFFLEMYLFFQLLMVELKSNAVCVCMYPLLF